MRDANDQTLKSLSQKTPGSLAADKLMKNGAFPDEFLAELAQSKSALTSALALLAVEQRRLESELQQLRASARPSEKVP